MKTSTFISPWSHQIDMGRCYEPFENPYPMEEICRHGQGEFHRDTSPHAWRNPNLQCWRKRGKNNGRRRGKDRIGRGSKVKRRRNKDRRGRGNKNIRIINKGIRERGNIDRGRKSRDEKRRGGEEMGERISPKNNSPPKGIYGTEQEVVATLATLGTLVNTIRKQSRPSQIHFRTKKSTRIRQGNPQTPTRVPIIIDESPSKQEELRPHGGKIKEVTPPRTKKKVTDSTYEQANHQVCHLQESKDSICL